MGKIVIIEEKADKMVNKLEKVRDCIEDVIDFFASSMKHGDEDYEEMEEEDWDDEYEVKRRRGNRQGHPHPTARTRPHIGYTRY